MRIHPKKCCNEFLLYYLLDIKCKVVKLSAKAKSYSTQILDLHFSSILYQSLHHFRSSEVCCNTNPRKINTIETLEQAAIRKPREWRPLKIIKRFTSEILRRFRAGNTIIKIMIPNDFLITFKVMYSSCVQPRTFRVNR